MTLWPPLRETDTVESEYLGSERSDKGDREMPSRQKNLTNFKKRSTLIINRNLFTKFMLLSENRYQRYHKLKQALEQLQKTAAQDNLDRAALVAEYKKVQQFFGNQIMTTDNSELESSETPAEQSYLTEIHKQLRMLGTDVTFLQASRQPATATARQTAAIERINTLIGYCGVLLPKNYVALDTAQKAELKTELTKN